MRAIDARKIPIYDYLSLSWVYPYKTDISKNELRYSSPIRTGDKNPSFKVNTYKNVRFDFGLSEGWNIIDLICLHKKISVKEVLFLLEKSGLSYTYKSDNNSTLNLINQSNTDDVVKNFAGEKEKLGGFEISEITTITDSWLINFLQKRAINIELAKKYLQQIKYKPKNTAFFFHALAWQCWSGYEVRSENFKWFIGTKKDIITLNLKNHQTVSIFEGFMDFLAFLTFYKKDNFVSGVIILNSINLKNKALAEIQKYQLKKVYLFLDNDTGWINTSHFFNDKIKNVEVKNMCYMYEPYNDFNDMIIGKKQWT